MRSDIRTPFSISIKWAIPMPYFKAAFAMMLLLLLCEHCVAADQWKITKENGAYRVNGCKLMADGKLVDRYGNVVQTLTKRQLEEIGEAINRYEPPPPSADVQIAEHKSRQHEAPAPPAEPSPPPATARPSNELPPSLASKDKKEDSLLSVIIAVLLFGIGSVVLYAWANRKRCPRCNSDAVRLGRATVLNSRQDVVIDRETRTTVFRDNYGNRLGSAEEEVPVARVRESNLVERQYSCAKCRHKWSAQGWE